MLERSKTLLPAAVLVAVAAFIVGGHVGAAPQEKEVAKKQEKQEKDAPRGPRALDVRVSEATELALDGVYRYREGPSKETLTAIGKVVDVPAIALADARLHHSRIPHPKDESKVAVTVCQVDLTGPMKGHRAVIVVDYTGIVAGAAVLDGHGNGSEEWSFFCSQFIGKKVPGVDGVRPLTRFKKTLADARQSKDDADKALVASVRLRELMLAQFGPVQSVVGKVKHGETVSDEQLASVRPYFLEIRKLGDSLSHWLGDATDSYTESAERVLTSLEQLAKVEDPKDIEVVEPLAEGVQKACMSCHGMKDHALGERGWMSAAAERRERLIGHGYFAVGYDVYPMHDDRDRSQAVATGIKAAELVVSSVLPRH